jgi:chitin deacetylase
MPTTDPIVIPVDRLARLTEGAPERPVVLVTSGAFNPVHRNHLLYLEAARAFLDAATRPAGAVRGPDAATERVSERVVGGYLSALPDRVVAGKRGSAIPHARRTAMLRLATAHSPWLMVAAGVHGAALFEAIERDAEAALGRPVTVVAVCGADGYRASERFLPTRFPLVCVRRTGEDDEWKRLWTRADPERRLYLVEENLQPEVRSATQVRELLSRAGSDPGAAAQLREHLHPDVSAYLLEHCAGPPPSRRIASTSATDPNYHESLERRVALTFDDGPGPSTGALLDALARHGARATFFLVGKNLRGFALGDERLARALAIREAREGHLLGNHADTHSREPMPLPAFVEEIRTVDALLREIYAEAGVAPPARFPLRLPYGPLVRPGGAQDERLEALAAAGKRHQHWTIILGDWYADAEAGRLAASLESHVNEMWARRRVPVIVLHDAGAWPRANGFDRSATVDAVERLCRALVPRGARFVTADELPE